MTRMLQRWLRADIELAVRTAPDLGQLHADQGSLEQVVMNLVVVRATPGSGKRTLAILRRHGDVVIAACNGDEAVSSCEAHPHTIHLLLTDMVIPGSQGASLRAVVAYPARDEGALHVGLHRRDR